MKKYNIHNLLHTPPGYSVRSRAASSFIRTLSASFIILLSVSFLSGCSKQLNVLPSTTEVDGQVIVDAKSASTALNGVYYKFADGGVDNNNVPSEFWVDVQEAVPSELSGLFENSSVNNLATHIYKPNSPETPYIWTYGYNIVNAANGFLKNIAPVTFLTSSAKQEMVAEARFLRAYANSLLLLYYGQYYNPQSTFGIILRNEFVTPGNINLPRSPVAEVYDSVFSDLDKAIAYLPNKNTQIAYANVWAAKLLKARILINRGAAGDYATVISLTNDVITNSPFILEPNVKDIFQTKALTSNEVILGVQPYPNQNYKYSSYIYYTQYQPSDTLISLFNNDPRAAWMLDSVASPYGTVLGFTKYYPGSYTNIAATPITENSYAIRLTEAYLLEAEALVASGGDMVQAKTLLKTVLSHAGITDFSAVDAAASASALQLLIVKEVMKNFAGEAGQDWYAVRRLPFTTLQSIIPTIGSPDLLILPIPQAEMVANGNMKQNPNY
jgi:starch-binding outer membrane protein, SusD/RagB family